MNWDVKTTVRVHDSSSLSQFTFESRACFGMWRRYCK